MSRKWSDSLIDDDDEIKMKFKQLKQRFYNGVYEQHQRIKIVNESTVQIECLLC